ncbi:MAG: hypothetical protein ACYDCH_07320 [Gaiellaceae bacterium]
MDQTLLESSQSSDQMRPEDEPCTAELAECSCPDFCERDHANE